jgi:hypothetical protein
MSRDVYRAVGSVEVRIWGRRVGAVALDPALGHYAFEYAPAFVRSGIELAPLMCRWPPTEEIRAGQFELLASSTGCSSSTAWTRIASSVWGKTTAASSMKSVEEWPRFASEAGVRAKEQRRVAEHHRRL